MRYIPYPHCCRVFFFYQSLRFRMFLQSFDRYVLHCPCVREPTGIPEFHPHDMIRYSTTCFGVHTVTARQTEGSILADRPSPTPIRPHLRGLMNYPLLFHISIRGLAVPPRNPSASPSEYEPLSSVREAESLPFPLFFFL